MQRHAEYDEDLQQEPDEVLIISADIEHCHSLSSLLQQSSLASRSVQDLCALSTIEVAATFDLVIFELESTCRSISRAISTLKAHPALKRTPVLILAPEQFEIDFATEDLLSNSKAQILFAPYRPADLMAKATLLLRQRKLSLATARADSDLLLSNARLRDFSNRYRRELHEAQCIQQALLPRELPQDEACAFAAKYQPLEAVGGDLYDVWPLGARRYGCLLADVTGHGLPAAFIGAMTKMARSFAHKTNPAVMLDEMNTGMTEHIPEGRFVTIIAAFYDATNGQLELACGGHPPAFLWRQQSASVERVKPEGMALGICAGLPYLLYRTALQVGDKLIFISDGLSELQNMEGQMLGLTGVSALLAAHCPANSISSCLELLSKAQIEFAGGRLLKDDTTLLGLERLA